MIEITANILKFLDSDGKELLPKIRDSAGQKGTGKWTAISALEYGMPVTLIGNVAPLPCTLSPTALTLLSCWSSTADRCWRQSVGPSPSQVSCPLSSLHVGHCLLMSAEVNADISISVLAVWF